MEDQKDSAARAFEALDRIAQEAYDKTGGDVFGTEPPPVESQPPTEPPPSDASSETDPAEPPATEPTSEPAKLVFGKYKTLEEAERGYWESANAMNLAKAEADAAKARLADVQKVATGTAPAGESDPLDEIENYGVPKAVIAKAIQKVARDEINAMFAPAMQRAEADKQIIQTHPEYQERFGEIERFVEGSPEIAQQVIQLNNSGNYLAARQIAYLNWKVSEGAKAVETKVAAESARKEEVKDARRDAGVGSTRRADTRTAGEKPVKTPEEEKRLLDLYKSGHPTPYLRHKLDGLLPSNFDDLSAQVLS